MNSFQEQRIKIDIPLPTICTFQLKARRNITYAKNRVFDEVLPLMAEGRSQWKLKCHITVNRVRCHLSTECKALQCPHHVIFPFVSLPILHLLHSSFSGNQSIVQDVECHSLYFRVSFNVVFCVVPRQECMTWWAIGGFICILPSLVLLFLTVQLVAVSNYSDRCNTC